MLFSIWCDNAIKMGQWWGDILPTYSSSDYYRLCYGPQPVSQQGNRATDDGALGLPKETPKMTEQGISVGWYTAMGTL